MGKYSQDPFSPPGLHQAAQPGGGFHTEARDPEAGRQAAAGHGGSGLPRASGDTGKFGRGVPRGRASQNTAVTTGEIDVEV